MAGPRAVATLPRPVFTPVDVFVGPVPGWTGAVAHADNYAGPPAIPAATANAYAATLKTSASPLPASADALPMRRGKAAARLRAKAAVAVAQKVPHSAKPAAAQRETASVAKPDDPTSRSATKYKSHDTTKVATKAKPPVRQASVKAKPAKGAAGKPGEAE